MKKNGLFSKIYAALIFGFLYLPIAVMIVFSFNSANSTAQFEGFSLRWYSDLMINITAQNALRNTLVLALTSAMSTVVLGTAAAVGIDRMRRRWTQKTALGVTNIPLMTPEIVTGIAMMLLFVFGGRIFGLTHILGFWSLLVAHITFCLPYVILSVLPKLRQTDPHLAEAAQDLGCSQLMSFFKVVLPAISTGVFSAFLMAFTLSLDNFVISNFTHGPGFQTLPLYIFSMTKRRVRPDMYALTSLIFLAMFLLLLGSNILQLQAEKRHKRKS